MLERGEPCRSTHDPFRPSILSDIIKSDNNEARLTILIVAASMPLYPSLFGYYLISTTLFMPQLTPPKPIENKLKNIGLYKVR